MTIGTSAWYKVLTPASMSMWRWRDVHMVDLNLYFHFLMLRYCVAVYLCIMLEGCTHCTFKLIFPIGAVEVVGNTSTSAQEF